LNLNFSLETAVTKANLSIGDLIALFEEFKINYADEFIIFNLSQMALPLLIPALKNKMKIWKPFDQISKKKTSENLSECHMLLYCHDVYRNLKELLGDKNFNFNQQQAMNPYHRILWETWVIVLRKLIGEESIRNISIECADLIKKWSDIVPGWIVEHLLDQVVLPKLISEVEDWNPLVDTVPIHLWIHPWLLLMKDRLESNLFAQIRHKLSNALVNWHPSDLSAKAILSPWKPPVFSSGIWDIFVCKNILPKLEMVLNEEFIINPKDQDLGPWNWVMSWQELIPTSNLVTLIENHFFPKWLQSLSIWLNSSPNYDDVSKWYIDWKSMFAEKLTQHPTIKTKLGQGLLMMNRSLSGATVSYTNMAIQSKQQQEPSNDLIADNIKVCISNLIIF
jgi:tuftelin-interacting protein 11